MRDEKTPICDALNVKVNVDAIAAGLLDITEYDLEECYRNALKFGMLPAPLMQKLDDMLLEKFLGIFKVSNPDADCIAAPDWKNVSLDAAKYLDRIDNTFTVRDIVKEISSAVAKSMYKQAEMVV